MSQFPKLPRNDSFVGSSLIMYIKGKKIKHALKHCMVDNYIFKALQLHHFGICVIKLKCDSQLAGFPFVSWM